MISVCPRKLPACTPSNPAMPMLARCTLLLTLSVSISAQQSTGKQPKFVLPAGVYALDELVERVVQARGTPIRIDEQTRSMLHDHRIVLHHELQLPPRGFADVVATLLVQQGVALVREGETGNLQAVNMAEHGSEFASFAKSQTVAEVLAHPHRASCVTTLVGTGEVKPALARNFVRPFMGMSTDRWNLQTAVEDGKVRLTGLTDQVAFGIALLHRLCDQAGANMPSLPDWDEGDAALHSWPGGRLPRSKLFALAAVELGCNLVHVDEPSKDPSIDLGKPAQLRASDWFVRLCEALRGEDMLLLPVVTEHRVFQLFDGNESGQQPPAWHAQFMTPEDALARKHLLFVSVLIRPPVSSPDAANALMPNRKGLSVASMGPNHLMITGPRDYVAEALKIVRAL